MYKGRFATLIAAVLYVGCSAMTSDTTEESQAKRHMRLAISFEKGSSLRQALAEYTIVAEHFKNSTAYPAAVRKVAVLNCNPHVPFASDSAALYWFRTYLALDPPARDRESAQVCIALLQRLAMLNEQVARTTATSDSLLAVSRKQSAELSNKIRRLQEAESTLNEVNSRLRRMKDVDMQTRRRGENK